jgi:alkylation response protein AidB-like acyl-CoA dehydrogenase
MRFGWDEQQVLLRSMLERFVSERRAARSPLDEPVDFDAEEWRELAELGVLGLPFAEDDGGSGGSPLDVVLAMQAFGRGLVTAPYLSTVILAGGLLREAGAPDQRGAHLPDLIAGKKLLAFGFAEPGSRFNPVNVATRAAPREAGGFALSGEKSVVLGAPHAQACFITARTAGERQEAAGVSLFLVPMDAPGLKVRSYRCLDGFAAADLTLEGVEVGAEALYGPLNGAAPIVRRVLDQATVAICGEAVGAMAALNDRCVDYAKTRRAFGQAIGDFQAIQHRLVDMQIAYEMASAITLKAAAQLAAASPAAARAVAGCKAQVGEEAAFVGKTAVQLHGAIGITEELDVGRYFKRLMAIRTSFGDTDHHLRRRLQLEGEAAPEATHGY